MLTTKQGSDRARDLLAQLEEDLQDNTLTTLQRQTLLEQLKILGRNPANSEAIFADQGIATLAKYGFDVDSAAVSQEAMRCLANAMLLNEHARQTFLDLGYSTKTAEKLRIDGRDDEFLASRILFYLTYTKKLDIELLANKHGLSESIIRNLDRHAVRYGKSAATLAASGGPMLLMSMEETLKLIPNLVYHRPDMASRLSGAIPSILVILKGTSPSTPPLAPPVSSLINALMNLDLPAVESTPNPLFPASAETSQISLLTTILDQALTAYPEHELDTAAAPLITLLRRAHEVAPAPARAYLQATLLPNEQSRAQPLGQDDTLASRLLRLSISPTLLLLRESISALLFELSDSDASTLIRNIGYGYASGFLATHNIDVPAEMLESDAPSSAAAGDVNPVTGQRRDAEPLDAGPEMTDEEKEREAERLFVLFERLRATGVVDVQNPIRQAVEEGRFEEIE